MILGQPLSDSQPIADLRKALLDLTVRLPQMPHPGPASAEVYGGVNDQMLNSLAWLASRLQGIPSSVKTALQGMPVAVAIAQASGSAAVARVMTAVRSAVAAAASPLKLAVMAYRLALGAGSGGASAGVRYPAGSITSFFGGKWHVATPIGTQIGLGESAFMIEGPDLTLFEGGHGGSYGGRWHGGGFYRTGQSQETPRNRATQQAGLSGATHIDQGVVPTSPVGPTVVLVAEKPFKVAVGGQFYKQSWFWAVVGGVVVLSGGTYLALRRKKGRR